MPVPPSGWEVCCFVGYFGTTLREMQRQLELLGEAYGKTRAGSASWLLCHIGCQNTVKPPPLARVGLTDTASNAGGRRANHLPAFKPEGEPCCAQNPVAFSPGATPYAEERTLSPR